MVKINYMGTVKVFADNRQQAEAEAMAMVDDSLDLESEDSLADLDYYYHDVSVTRCDETGRAKL